MEARKALFLIGACILFGIFIENRLNPIVEAPNKTATLQARIERVIFHGTAGPPNTPASFEVTIRNTGILEAIIDSITIWEHKPGTPAYLQVTMPSNNLTYPVHDTHSITIACTTWLPDTEYTVRMTLKKNPGDIGGFYYEVEVTSPKTIPAE